MDWNQDAMKDEGTLSKEVIREVRKFTKEEPVDLPSNNLVINQI